MSLILKLILTIFCINFQQPKISKLSLKKDLNSKTMFYSYWFMQWIMTLSILKLKYPSIKIISRVHGADYDESMVKRILPFRYFQLSKVNKIFPVSLFGKKYLEKEFKVSENKIEVARIRAFAKQKIGPNKR